MAGNKRTSHWMRKAHRWLGLAIGIQLLFWTVSGLYFALIPIETVRGEDRVREAEPVNFAHTPLLSPQQVIDSLIERDGPSLQVRKVELRRVLGAPVYEIRYQVGGEGHIQLANASSGELLPALTREQAVQLARQDFAVAAAVLSTDYIEAVAGDGEYRGGPLPAWRVNFDDDDATRIYVSAELGRVTARRNGTWRIFDFLWMLHIMDFKNRDDFNTVLLQLFATLGVITIISGFILWGMTTSLFRRQRR
jgi:uncharacterized iron-regulated membrane protein